MEDSRDRGNKSDDKEGIKKLMRTVIAATKFPMPRIILKTIAFYANEMKNYSSNSGNINSISPYKFITNGRPLDCSVVCKGKVLDYVEASDENMIQRNSVLKRRTISGIYRIQLMLMVHGLLSMLILLRSSIVNTLECYLAQTQ